jgi:hypothetical protein
MSQTDKNTLTSQLTAPKSGAAELKRYNLRVSHEEYFGNY